MLRTSASRILSRTPQASTRLHLSTSRPAMAMLGEGDAKLFEQHAVKGDRLTVVDFHADWCPPCKMLGPVLDKVFSSEDSVDLLKINTDNETEIAAKYKITSLPTVVAIKHGKELSRFVGLVNEDAVKNFLANVKD